MTSEQLFTKVWEAMEDMLGPGATATVLRRAVQLAENDTPGVRGPMIRREGLAYRFRRLLRGRKMNAGPALTCISSFSNWAHY